MCRSIPHSAFSRGVVLDFPCGYIVVVSDLLIGSDWHFQEREHFLLGFGEFSGKDHGVIARGDFVSLNVSERV